MKRAEGCFLETMVTVSPLPYAAAGRRAMLLTAAAWLTGCGSSPPVQLYHLRSQTPVDPGGRVPAAEIWQLTAVRLPEYLDREAILLPQGQTGLLALSGHRWAESLRDAVPRVLLADLLALRGAGRVWRTPLPGGVVTGRSLRVELLAFEAEAERAAVLLDARWTLADSQGRSAPSEGVARLRVPAAGNSIDSLVAAHRLALWQLAERIASTA